MNVTRNLQNSQRAIFSSDIHGEMGEENEHDMGEWEERNFHFHMNPRNPPPPPQSDSIGK